MSDHNAPRGGGNNRRRRNNRGRNNRRRRPAPPKQTGFQKFLSTISFGLLGKPTPKKKPATKKPRREPTSNVTVVKSKKPGRDMGPPDPDSVKTERLYVGNLSYDASESDLFELFNGVGKVGNAEVVVNNRTQRSKGFAFVTMDSIEEARRAVSELHGKDFMGRPLQINGAKPQPQRREESPDSEEAPAETAEATEAPADETATV